MNTQEFKAWFDGFTEGLEGEPSKKQWARIKGRVKEIDTTAFTPHTVFVDRYRWWGGQAYPYSLCSNGVNLSCNNEQGYNQAGSISNSAPMSLVAFNALGKNDSMECASV